MALRLEQGKNVEMTLDTNDIKYQTRKNVGREYFDWIFLVGGLKVKLQSLIYLIFVVTAVAFFVSEWLLLVLFPLFIVTFMVQFTWGDKLDDKVTWEEKNLTEVQGVK